MKAEELKSKIQVETQDAESNQVRIVGKLEVRAVMYYDRQALALSQDAGAVLDEIKERIREMIMRHIYDDQRRELSDALLELFKANPLDYSAMEAARNKILKAAKRQ